MSTMGSPMLYAALLDRATTRPAEQLSQRLTARLRTASDGVADALVDELRAAYTAGLNDGFAQGVAAEAKRANQAPGGASTP